jgi:hypothetical protein
LPYIVLNLAPIQQLAAVSVKLNFALLLQLHAIVLSFNGSIPTCNIGFDILG